MQLIHALYQNIHPAAYLLYCPYHSYLLVFFLLLSFLKIFRILISFLFSILFFLLPTCTISNSTSFLPPSPYFNSSIIFVFIARTYSSFLFSVYSSSLNGSRSPSISVHKPGNGNDTFVLSPEKKGRKSRCFSNEYLASEYVWDLIFFFILFSQSILFVLFV